MENSLNFIEGSDKWFKGNKSEILYKISGYKIGDEDEKMVKGKIYDNGPVSENCKNYYFSDNIKYIFYAFKITGKILFTYFLKKLSVGQTIKMKELYNSKTYGTDGLYVLLANYGSRTIRYKSKGKDYVNKVNLFIEGLKKIDFNGEKKNYDLVYSYYNPTKNNNIICMKTLTSKTIKSNDELTSIAINDPSNEILLYKKLNKLYLGINNYSGKNFKINFNHEVNKKEGKINDKYVNDFSLKKIKEFANMKNILALDLNNYYSYMSTIDSTNLYFKINDLNLNSKFLNYYEYIINLCIAFKNFPEKLDNFLGTIIPEKLCENICSGKINEISLVDYNVINENQINKNWNELRSIKNYKKLEIENFDLGNILKIIEYYITFLKLISPVSETKSLCYVQYFTHFDINSERFFNGFIELSSFYRYGSPENFTFINSYDSINYDKASFLIFATSINFKLPKDFNFNLFDIDKYYSSSGTKEQLSHIENYLRIMNIIFMKLRKKNKIESFDFFMEFVFPKLLLTSVSMEEVEKKFINFQKFDHNKLFISSGYKKEIKVSLPEEIGHGSKINRKMNPFSKSYTGQTNPPPPENKSGIPLLPTKNTNNITYFPPPPPPSSFVPIKKITPPGNKPNVITSPNKNMGVTLKQNVKQNVKQSSTENTNTGYVFPPNTPPKKNEQIKTPSVKMTKNFGFTDMMKSNVPKQQSLSTNSGSDIMNIFPPANSTFNAPPLSDEETIKLEIEKLEKNKFVRIAPNSIITIDKIQYVWYLKPFPNKKHFEKDSDNKFEYKNFMKFGHLIFNFIKKNNLCKIIYDASDLIHAEKKVYFGLGSFYFNFKAKIMNYKMNDEYKEYNMYMLFYYFMYILATHTEVILTKGKLGEKYHDPYFNIYDIHKALAALLDLATGNKNNIGDVDKAFEIE